MEEVEKKVTVSRVKNILYTEIKSINELYNKKNQLKDKLNMLNDIKSVLNTSVVDFEYNLEGLRYLMIMCFSPLRLTKLYENIVKDFFAMKFNNINDMNFIDYSQNAKELYTLILEKEDELEVNLIKIDHEIESKKDKKYKYEWFLKNIKNNGYISTKDFDIFVDLLREYGYSSIDAIKLNELIVNNYKKMNGNQRPNYSILKMLDSSFDKMEVSDKENYLYKDKYESIINSYFEVIEKNDLSYILDDLPDYNNSINSVEEFDYFYKSLINKIVDKINEYITDIKDLDLYKELKYDISKEYRMYLEVYKYIKALYYKERKKIASRLNVNEEIKTPINTLLYLDRARNDSFLERDVKHMPEELYSDMLDLLTRLKYGQVTTDEFKGFTNNEKLREYMELKDDQIRILFRMLGNNRYMAIGAFQKKDDNDIPHFISIANRYEEIDLSKEEVLKEQLDQAALTEERLGTFLKENARKGNR